MWFLREFGRGNRFYQTLVSLNLGAICVGLTMGWPNPAIESDIYGRNQIFGFEDSLELQTVLNFGASIGAFCPMLIADIYGRRFSFLCSGVSCSIFWICMTSAANRALILVSASVGGFGVGVYVTTTILYVGEISSSTNRGVVGAFTSLFANFGFLVVTIVSLYVDLKTLADIIVVIPLIYTFSIFGLMVESPYFLFHRGKVLDAKISLKNLRCTRTVLEVEDEYRSLENFFNSDHQTKKKTTKVLMEFFCPKSAKKSVILIFPFLCLSQMIGSYAMNHYLEKLLKFFVPQFEYVVLSSMNVISVGICLYAIEKIGRRPVLIISIVGSAICCLFLAIHKLTQYQDCESLIKGDLVISLLFLLAYYGVYFLGLIPLLPILAGEIFPNRVKTVAAGICVSLVYVAALSVQSVYEFMKTKTNSCSTFGCFAILGSIGLPLIVFSLPETKGKSLHQIQSEMDTMSIIIP